MGIFNLFSNKREYEQADIYIQLRNQALSLTQDKITSLLEPSMEILGVLMETGYEEAVATLATFADGTVSFYFSNGGGIIGVGEHEEPRKAGLGFLSFASQFIPKARPISDFPLPTKGYTIFYFITKKGIFSATAKENDLGNNRSPLSPLFHKAHEVISEARIVDEQIQRNIQALMHAVTTGDEAKLIEMLDAKTNPNISDSSGLTPLMAGANSGHEKILKLLLDHKSTIDQKDASGYTALMFACNAGKLNCAKLLIEYGANIHEEANDGSTPIMFCAQHGHNDVVLFLLSKGADPSHMGKHGLSAIGFAKQNNLVETEKILLEKRK